MFDVIATAPAGSAHDDGIRPDEPAASMSAPDLAGICQIDWRQSADSIVAFIRMPQAIPQTNGSDQSAIRRAQATINSQTIDIVHARVGGTMSSYPPGTITRCDEQVWVQAGRGHVEIQRVMVDGQEHPAADYFAAAGLVPGDLFDRSHSWPESQPRNRSRDAA